MDNFNGGRYGENIEEVAARTMALFYLFDKSGSMSGTKIGQVNYAMKDIPKEERPEFGKIVNEFKNHVLAWVKRNVSSK